MFLNEAKMSNSQREVLQEIKDKSEDDYEKNITYISAGALGVSITFLSEIIDVNRAEYILLIITSWIFFAITLISNLCSHLYSSYIMDLSMDDEDDQAMANWKRRTRKIRIWNIFNVVLLMFGITLFVIFVSLNIPAMSKAKNDNSQASKPSSTTEQHGRTPVKPNVIVVKPPDTVKESTSTKNNSINK